MCGASGFTVEGSTINAAVVLHTVAVCTVEGSDGDDAQLRAPVCHCDCTGGAATLVCNVSTGTSRLPLSS